MFQNYLHYPLCYRQSALSNIGEYFSQYLKKLIFIFFKKYSKRRKNTAGSLLFSMSWRRVLHHIHANRMHLRLNDALYETSTKSWTYVCTRTSSSAIFRDMSDQDCLLIRFNWRTIFLMYIFTPGNTFKTRNVADDLKIKETCKTPRCQYGWLIFLLKSTVSPTANVFGKELVFTGNLIALNGRIHLDL